VRSESKKYAVRETDFPQISYIRLQKHYFLVTLSFKQRILKAVAYYYKELKTQGKIRKPPESKYC
jgi:hypothetical protein